LERQRFRAFSLQGELGQNPQKCYMNRFVIWIFLINISHRVHSNFSQQEQKKGALL
jgi:hypothetical protein